jgi:hypothetical protein
MLLLSINATVFGVAQKADIVSSLWGNCNRPKMLRLDYVRNNDVIKIPCDSDIEIVINEEKNRRQLIEVVKAGEVQYDFFSKYIVDPFYLWAVYRIYLDPVDNVKILLVAYAQGVTGLGANMTFSMLFDIANNGVQYLSTWGSVEEHFFDIDDDGECEFISVDYCESNDERLLVANVFKRDAQGFFSENISLNSETIFVFSFEYMEIREINWKQNNLSLLKRPDVFEFDRHYRW